MADCGRIVLVGQVTGEFLSIKPAQLFLSNITILSAKGVSRAQLADALDLVARRQIRPVIEDVCALEDAADAHERVEAGQVTGRLVLNPTR